MLDEAIKELKILRDDDDMGWELKEVIAFQLGIEALERIKEVRESEFKPSLVLLATAKLPSEEDL